jgi:uncharacterized protein
MLPAMNQIDVLPLFLLGILGTGHCIGMCGPLVIAFPGRTGRSLAHLWYHGGRILTYVLVGGLMGGVGAAMTHIAAGTGGNPLVWMARTQIFFSLLAAVFLLVFGLVRIGIMTEPIWMTLADPQRVPFFGRLLRTGGGGGNSGQFALGLALGLLPCGLSFAAFARALASTGPVAGMVMLAAFGLGTLPGLLLVGLGAGRLLRRYRRASDVLSGMLMIGMAAGLAAQSIAPGAP